MTLIEPTTTIGWLVRATALFGVASR